ncbi:MAG: flagellar FlbD family protein [Candidatus Glassbacteria bacterium]|nr:flagellar FlbD family protein [Candidatus Glassbacteria bacterium]
MITLTKLNGQEMVINAELIESVEKTPDTIVGLVTGKRFMVRETVEDVVALVMEYRRQLPPFWRKVAQNLKGQ